MALFQDKIPSGFLSDSMKQETEKPPHSPSLNNNNPALFPNMIAPSATQPLQMTMQHQLFLASQFMSRLPLFANPALFPQQQNVFNSWSPRVVSSPSPTSIHVADPIGIKYTSPKSSNNNNSSSATNNNVVSSTVDRLPNKRSQPLKRRISQEQVRKPQPDSSPAAAEGSGPQSPSCQDNTPKDTRDRNFTCKVCLRSFGYKHVLQNHERTHTGEKPFECPECHKRFTRDHHLKTHLRLHTGEKPYHCDHCHRKFVQVANLRRHLRVHTGERPYICEICQYKFSDSNQLKAHKLSHEDEKPVKCQLCDARFCKKSQLTAHKCKKKVSPPTPPARGKDLKVEVDFEVDNRRHALTSPAQNTLSSLPKVISNLSQSLSNLPEQTEPEDLSMSTGMHRPYSSSQSNGDSSMSRSPSIDTVKDEEDEDELDVSDASPSSLFLKHQKVNNKEAEVTVKITS